MPLVGFSGGSDGKESTCNAGDLGLIPGEGNSYPLQYSCLENFMDRREAPVVSQFIDRVQLTPILEHNFALIM